MLVLSSNCKGIPVGPITLFPFSPFATFGILLDFPKAKLQCKLATTRGPIEKLFQTPPKILRQTAKPKPKKMGVVPPGTQYFSLSPSSSCTSGGLHTPDKYQLYLSSCKDLRRDIRTCPRATLLVGVSAAWLQTATLLVDLSTANFVKVMPRNFEAAMRLKFIPQIVEHKYLTYMLFKFEVLRGAPCPLQG